MILTYILANQEKLYDQTGFLKKPDDITKFQVLLDKAYFMHM